MFTGIVQAKAKVKSIEPRPFGRRLIIDRANWRPPNDDVPGHGDSICISGVCLTVVESTESTLSFDVIIETLNKTTLGDLQPGSAVNIEPSVTPHQPLGGHFMQGHVDATGEIASVTDSDGEWRVAIRPPAHLMAYIVPKGSIAIDGISLTIASVTDDTFDVALIPTTLELTTLGNARVGDKVNLETDILARTIVHQLRRMEKGGDTISKAVLEKAGFTG